MHASTGYCRLILETSPDGAEPWDRTVIARGDDASEYAATITGNQTCDCKPIDIGDGDIIEHEADCPRYYDHVHTAEGITAIRQMLMRGDDGNQLRLFVDRPTRERMARGITARAVELGLEQP